MFVHVEPVPSTVTTPAEPEVCSQGSRRRISNGAAVGDVQRPGARIADVEIVSCCSTSSQYRPPSPRPLSRNCSQDSHIAS